MNAEPKQRLFVGIELPDAARAMIEDLGRPLRGIDGLRWVPPENLHLTLAFLGWVDADARDGIDERLAAAAVDAAPFTAVVGSLGRFPDRGKARVVWVGLEDPSGALAQLARLVGDALEDLFEPETRPFRPHVTIARARRPVAIRMPDEAAPPTRTEVPVTALTLFRSHLGREHPRYEVLRRWGLGAQPAAIP
jgi:2'-5' RNA ligase